MINVFLVIQIIISIFLVISIILQKDSTDSLTGLSGSGLNKPVVTQNTQTLLAKITKYLGIFFFINCLILSNLAVRQGKATSLLDKINDEVIEKKQEIPVGE